MSSSRWIHVESAPSAVHDRLEWLGDAVLGELVARLLVDAWLERAASAQIPRNPLRLFRDTHDLLVSNKVLSGAYHHESPELDGSVRRGSRETKRDADTVEAYLGKHHQCPRQIDAVMYDLIHSVLTQLPAAFRLPPTPRSNSFVPLASGSPGTEVAGLEHQGMWPAGAADRRKLRESVLLFYGSKVLLAALSLELHHKHPESSSAELTLLRQALTQRPEQLAQFAAARHQAAAEALAVVQPCAAQLPCTEGIVCAMLGEPSGAWVRCVSLPSQLPQASRSTQQLLSLIWPLAHTKRLRDPPRSSAPPKRPKLDPRLERSRARFRSVLSKKSQSCLKKNADSQVGLCVEACLLWFIQELQPASGAQIAAMLNGSCEAQAPAALAELAHALELPTAGVEEWHRPEQLTLPLTSGFHRLLAHSLAQYHGLDSESSSCAVRIKAPPALKRTKVGSTPVLELLPHLKS